MKRTLYLERPGVSLEQHDGHLALADGERVLDVPLDDLGAVVFVGGVGATPSALGALLEHGIPGIVIGHGGRVLGRLQPERVGDAALRMAQYDRSRDPVFALALAARIVDGKLANARALTLRLARAGRDGSRDAAQALAQIRRRVPRATDLEELRGLEGIGARTYFAALRQAVRQPCAFGARSRRPPRDPANAMLSFLYALLYAQCVRALALTSLDLGVGVLHADRYGRASLALDLMEVFRPLLADSTFLVAVNRRSVSGRDWPDTGECRLRPRALRRLAELFGARLGTRALLDGRRVTYHDALVQQARLLADAFRSGDPAAYRPLVSR